MKKPVIIIIAILVAVAAVVGVMQFKKMSTTSTATIIDNSQPDLPINTIPVSERPFITLTPDKTGHSLNIAISNGPSAGMEYEMIYNATGKQEGALGSIILSTEKQPIVKEILLGSRSAGGATTYHEGVTGGSLTVTYNNIRLKESWNYFHFDALDPTFSTTDGKLHVTLAKTGLKDDTVIVTMKTFGYLKTGLPEDVKVIAGPYSYYAQTPVKGSAQIELTLPAGEHVNPTIYEYTGTTWKKLATKLTGDKVSATSSGNVFLVTAE